MTDVGPVAILSKEHTKLPREKRVPEMVKDTKWEKYATEKGILKRKRDRLEWSDTEQKYVPTWGYQSAKDEIDEQGFIELKAEQNRDFNSYIMKKQKHDHMFKTDANLRRHYKGLHPRVKVGRSADIIDNSLDIQVLQGVLSNSNGTGNKKKNKTAKSTLKMVQRSTASMGQFDEPRKGEIARKNIREKQSLRSNTKTDEETILLNSIIRQVERKELHRKSGFVNSMDVYEGVIPDASLGPSRKGRSRRKT